MKQYDEVFNEYCVAYYRPEYKCFCAEAQHFAYFNATDAFCPAPLDMDPQGKRSFESLQSVSHTFWTIVTALFYFAIARISLQLWKPTAHTDSALRFILEFAIIAIPTVISVNVANEFVECFDAIMFICLLWLMWKTNCRQQASERCFEIGTRPCMLTLARATINFLTALCILAIDFDSFPKNFRKSRRYGAGLMDVGIGLFVFSMGTVSRRPTRVHDLHRLIRVVMPVLLLGLARTIVIIAIDYHQDEHEYGMHLNAFFTLGLTKLFGTLLSAVATSDTQLLPLGLGTLALHETILQMGLSDFVMDNDLERNTFWTANREGICSLPGFVGLYIISIYIGQWLQSKSTLSFNEFCAKLVSMTLVSAAIWLLVLISIFTIGIARVTCNFGYAAWILGIAVTMVLLFMIVFDLVLNTIWPIESKQQFGAGDEAQLISKSNRSSQFQIPVLVQAVNYNGLTFFLLANVLTGGVNIFLKPEDRTALDSVIILTFYMLLATGFVYIMYRLKIRIA